MILAGLWPNNNKSIKEKYSVFSIAGHHSCYHDMTTLLLSLQKSLIYTKLLQHQGKCSAVAVITSSLKQMTKLILICLTATENHIISVVLRHSLTAEGRENQISPETKEILYSLWYLHSWIKWLRKSHSVFLQTKLDRLYTQAKNKPDNFDLSPAIYMSEQRMARGRKGHHCGLNGFQRKSSQCACSVLDNLHQTRHTESRLRHCAMYRSEISASVSKVDELPNVAAAERPFGQINNKKSCCIFITQYSDQTCWELKIMKVLCLKFIKQSVLFCIFCAQSEGKCTFFAAILTYNHYSHSVF